MGLLDGVVSYSDTNETPNKYILKLITREVILSVQLCTTDRAHSPPWRPVIYQKYIRVHSTRYPVRESTAAPTPVHGTSGTYFKI
eukprot:SAG31_NODE_21395_length_550_cov_1.711752_1_plen_84_part_10